MITVWVVAGYDSMNEYGWIDSAWSTQELAAARTAAIPPSHRVSYETTEVVVDTVVQ